MWTVSYTHLDVYKRQILAFSLTDIFDTIGTLIGTGEKVGIVATNGENHQSAKLDKALYSDLVATSVGAIAVSYTHLDVYKRQIRVLALKNEDKVRLLPVTSWK